MRRREATVEAARESLSTNFSCGPDDACGPDPIGSRRFEVKRG